MARDPLAAGLGAAGAHMHPSPTLDVRAFGASPTTLLRYGFGELRDSVAALRIARAVRPDCVCVNAENILLMPWVGRMLGVRTVVAVHGARFASLGRLGKAYFGIQGASGAVYVAVSDFVGTGLVRMGLDPRRVFVVHNGVDVARFQPGPSDPLFRKRLGIAEDAVVIGSICHLTPRKGLHHLIEIAAAVAAEYPTLTCLIVGTEDPRSHGTYRDRLESRARELGIAQCLRFLGLRDDVERILREMDVLVHPSETESFGRTIAEAMASGKPVVGFDVDAVSELIDHEKTGLVVRQFDAAAAASAVRRLLGDAPLRTTMGTAGRAKACLQYEMHRQAAKFVDVLENSANCS
jgi:glycosyltransferase involved in cell wall biosynthesis